MTTSAIRIIGHRLPGRVWADHANVHVGVQRRSEVIDLTPGDAVRAVFSVPLEITLDPANGVDYRGPFVHGRRGQRFLYLSWGDVAADGAFVMFRRAKLTLFTLPDHIARALADGCTVHAELELTDPDGGPVCASIPTRSISWSIDDASC